MLDTDILIPTEEEIEETIKHITETGNISFEDEMVLFKMKFIKLILNSKGERI